MAVANLQPHVGLLEAESPRQFKIHRRPEVRLVVIVPALNEERTIGDVVRRVPREIGGVDEVEVVVVNDGSSDRTAEVAYAEGAVVVNHPRLCGVGSAFQSGLRKAFEMGADIVVNVDGDGQFNPEDIPRLIAPILSHEADFATASRFKDPNFVPQMPAIKIWGNRQVSRLISWLTKSKYYDVSCGMRAYGREAALNLSLLESFTYTHEVFLHMSNKRMRIVEVPIRVRGERQYGKSRVASNLFRYARNVLLIVFRFYRDFYPIRFFGCTMAACLLVALPLLGFTAYHVWTTGQFTPHKWAALLGGASLAGAVASFFMGIVGDMLHRQRVYMEEIQYLVRSLIVQGNRRER